MKLAAAAVPVLAAVTLLACSSGTAGEANTAHGDFDVQPSPAGDTAVAASGDTSEPGPGADATTPGADTAAPAADTLTPGCTAFGCPCTADADCDSDLCVLGPDGRICTVLCTDGCPSPDFDCRVADEAATDPISACYPSTLHLCAPCRADAECTYRGGERCIPATDPDLGSFCTTPCDAAGACPDGYRCAELPFDGALEPHCVPSGGLCDCRPSWADQGLGTDCNVVNDHGACPGTRTCEATGLSACLGPPPAEERCNGLDDDCDGLVDNVAPNTPCDLVNAFGTCRGTLSCAADGTPLCTGTPATAETCNGQDDDCDGVADDGTCDDGLACTADRCAAPGSCDHAILDGFCLIAGACWPAHAENPAATCERCEPAVSTTAWTGSATGGHCLIAGQCIPDGAQNPADPCQVCRAATSASAWSTLDASSGDADHDGLADACDPCTDANGDGLADPGFPVGQCPGDACGIGAALDPAACCSVGLACEGDDHLVTTFSCVDPGAAAGRYLAFYGDLCCYDASDEALYCTAYGEWSAGSGRDTNPDHSPALVSVTADVGLADGRRHHDTDWLLSPNFFSQNGNFCQFTGEAWAVDAPAATLDKASYPGEGYPVAQWNYRVDPSGSADVSCGGSTGTGPHDTCLPPVAGAPLHTVSISLNADDGWEGWLNGQSLGPEQATWSTIETSTHQLAEGCHVLAVHAQDHFQVVSGFQGRVQVDGVDKYLTGTTAPLWRMTASEPPDQFGVSWRERPYDATTAAWFEPLVCTYTGWYGTAVVNAMKTAGAPMVWWGTPACTGLGEAWIRLEVNVP